MNPYDSQNQALVLAEQQQHLARYNQVPPSPREVRALGQGQMLFRSMLFGLAVGTTVVAWRRGNGVVTSALAGMFYPVYWGYRLATYDRES